MFSYKTEEFCLTSNEVENFGALLTFKFLALFRNLGLLEGIFVFCKNHLVKKLYSYLHAKSQIIELKSVHAINICKIILFSLRSMSFLKIFLHQVQYYIWGFQNVFICLNLIPQQKKIKPQERKLCLGKSLFIF